VSPSCCDIVDEYGRQGSQGLPVQRSSKSSAIGSLIVPRFDELMNVLLQIWVRSEGAPHHRRIHRMQRRLFTFVKYPFRIVLVFVLNLEHFHGRTGVSPSTVLWVTNAPNFAVSCKFSMRHGVIKDETWNDDIERIPRDHVERLLVRKRVLSSIQVFPVDCG
jgi:hypothetical protein